MKYMYLLLAVPSIAFAQVDTRIIDTVPSRGNPPTEKVVRPEPPRRVDPPARQEMPQPPRNINRPFPLPMDPYWMSRGPSRVDCFDVPPQLQSICMDKGMLSNRSSMNRRPTNKPLRQQIRQATPQQRRAIQQARKEFQQKVRRILKKK
jgi:hypothetical protein